jgi:hypothetical protein
MHRLPIETEPHTNTKSPAFSKLALLILSTACIVHASSGQGKLDPAFEKVPFDKWLAEPDQKPFHWSVNVPRAALSFHQRFISAVEIEIDGRDLETRRGEGRLVCLTRITDHSGAPFQYHSSIEFSKLDENIKAATIQTAQRVFLLPGDYQLAVIALDTHTGEHYALQSRFKVPSAPNDFLAAAWRNLPPVEFIQDSDSPESWYLPNIGGHLRWAASVENASLKPARINIILNVAPSVRVPGTRPTPGAGLAALLPTLKAISQTGSTSVSENIELLDLARRRAVFHQDNSQDLDWPALKTSLGDSSTASIDIHSLSERHQDAQFFVSEVRKILRASESPCVVVVLTTAVAFEQGEDLNPISLEALPPCRVFYIRYHARPEFTRQMGQPMGVRGRGGRMAGPLGGGMSHNPSAQDVPDQLESTMKPLNPKLYNVETPEEITKALAEIRKALP